MSEAFCKVCGHFMMFPDSHRCPPMWECWSEDYGETRERSAQKVRASDAEEAAEKYAEQSDEGGDYTIIKGSPVDVCVVPLGAPAGTKPSRFHVEGESVPEYTASAVDVVDALEDDDVTEAHTTEADG